MLNRPADVPVPLLGDQPGISASLAEQVDAQAAELFANAPHLSRHDIALDGLDQALAHVPVRLSTMGRGLDEDPAAFLAAAAAGRHAASQLATSRVDVPIRPATRPALTGPVVPGCE